MKVLIFNHAFFHLSETFIYQQVTGMPADINVELMGFDFQNENVFQLDNKKHVIKKSSNLFDRTLAFVLKRLFGIKPGIGVFSRSAIKRTLKEIKPDIIHAHFGFNALLIYPIARSLGIPLVVTFHGLDASPHFLKNNTYLSGINDVINYASAILIVSPHMISTLSLSKLENKTFLIPCGVDPDDFNSPARAGNSKVVHILHSGRVVGKKGVPDLVKVFIVLNKEYPDTRLHIIGDGPELEFSKELAADATEGSILFYGATPHAEVKKMMGDADIFVLNSRTSDSGDMEGLPVSILEAMSMRLPVVSTKHAGIPHIITNGSDGILTEEKDNNLLFDALRKLVTDEPLRRQLGEAARHTIMQRFTVGQVNRRIADVYRQITDVYRKA